MISDSLISLYIIGGLFAVGMSFSFCLSIALNGIKDAYDISDKIKAVLLALFLFIVFVVLNMLFSWIAAGFWLHQALMSIYVEITNQSIGR